MRKQGWIIFTLCLVGHLTMRAQSEVVARLETDPIATLFGAMTLSVVFETPKLTHWSLFLNVMRADFPDWMDDFLNPQNKGKGFQSKIKIGGGFSIDYFIDADHRGVYFGLLQLLFRNEVQLNELSRRVTSHNIIPRIGYRWFPFDSKRLYVNPFVGLRYEYFWKQHLVLNQQTFLPAGWQPFGTFHIGYSF